MDPEEIECHFKWRPCEDDRDADPEKCIDRLTANLDCYPTKNIAFLLIGYMNTQLRTPNYDEALAIFDEVIDECQNRTEAASRDEYEGYKIVAIGNKIHTLKQLEEHQEAENLAKLARDIGVPSDKTSACLKAVHAFALTNFGVDKYDDSLHLYQQAMELDPENPYWKMGFAFMAGRRRRVQEKYRSSYTVMEEEPLREAIRLTNWANSLPIVLLADILFAQGRKFRGVPKDKEVLDEAMSLFDQAFKLSPHSPHVLFRCGKAFFVIGRKDLGLRCLEEALQLDPCNSNTLFRLGLSYASYTKDKAKLDKAETCLYKAIEFGRRRHFYAELALGNLRHRRDPKYDLKKHFKDMQIYYFSFPGHLEQLDSEIKKIDRKQKNWINKQRKTRISFF